MALPAGRSNVPEMRGQSDSHVEPKDRLESPRGQALSSVIEFPEVGIVPGRKWQFVTKF